MRRASVVAALASGLVVLSAAPATSATAPAVRHATAGQPWPAYSFTVHRVTRRQLGKSWHRGCPVGPGQLREATLRYAGFDRRPHVGRLVIAADAVPAIKATMHSLYHHRFPIRRMQPISAYGGSDNRSMHHDNTSAFNCRYAVANGPKQWSEHAYGEAIDIDPVENPYVLDGKVRPPNGRPYTDRSRVRRGMITADGTVVRAFRAVGWGWGGDWSDGPDYQHFSVNGH